MNTFNPEKPVIRHEASIKTIADALLFLDKVTTWILYYPGSNVVACIGDVGIKIIHEKDYDFTCRALLSLLPVKNPIKCRVKVWA